MAFLFRLTFGCELILTGGFTCHPHVDISRYCIKENLGESKQASVFRQVTDVLLRFQRKAGSSFMLENGEQICSWEGQTPNSGSLGLSQMPNGVFPLGKGSS